jgi:hypothetical protein
MSTADAFLTETAPNPDHILTTYVPMERTIFLTIPAGVFARPAAPSYLRQKILGTV